MCDDSPVARVPLTYTFGNHMHWVDMEWLWGYDVLPGSVADMLRFCEETGAKGNLNFDAVGYERLAVQNPESFAQLRAAVRDGRIEIVGASYGQPYGGFQGGESNIRQRTVGVRTVERLFGVRPTTFWEEEFDFFPQLPQILRGAGFEAASLFFQWTWHTPEVPREESPVVHWEGHDGSRLPAASRHRLNVHQWPEDMDAVLAEAGEGGLLLQWLELMPSPDWMCRSETILPAMRRLLEDPRFDLKFATLGEYLRENAGGAPVRRYGPDDVFHGVSLGKNGDGLRRLSGSAEASLLTAETFASVAARFGRPYAQWDVYPAWELDEAWRELLQAQHHDNDECEGLCGHVGRLSYERSLGLSGHVARRTRELIARRTEGAAGELVVFNPLGWPVSATVRHPESHAPIHVVEVPAMGWQTVPGATELPEVWRIFGHGASARLGGMTVSVDAQGRISQIVTPEWPEGLLDEATPLLQIEYGDGLQFEFESMEVDHETKELIVRFRHPEQGGVRACISLSENPPAIDVSLAAGSLPRPQGGMNAGIRTRFALRGGEGRIITDSPYAVHAIDPQGTYRKKYPTGDWMTSEQWFEEVHRPFHSLSLVDLVDAGGERGLLALHDGSQQWFRDEQGVRNLLTMYDPWDEAYWVDRFQASYRLIPHGRISDSERWRAAQEFLRPPVAVVKPSAGGDVPCAFSFVSCDAPNVAITALYREAGDQPYVLRVVELDGKAGPAEIRVAGEIASASKTDLLGNSIEELGTEIRIVLRPYEIATVKFDLVEGRKQIRDLDAKREVWATVHR